MFHGEHFRFTNEAIRKVWPFLFQALPGGRNENAETYLIGEIMNKTDGQNGNGNQASAEHTAEVGSMTAADELDRLAAAQDEQAGEGDGTGGAGAQEGDGAEVGQNGDKGDEGGKDGKDDEGDARVTFTPQQQTILERRIGKEVAKTRALQEQLDAVKGNQSETEAEIARGIHLHPAYVGKDDFALIQSVNALETEQEALTDLDEDSVSLESLPAATQKWVKENYPKAESVDKKMISKRILTVQRDLHAKAAKADEVYSAAKKQQLSDLALGRKIRMERDAARLKAGADAGGKGRPADAPLRTGTRPVATGAETRQGGVNQQKLAAGGNTAEALIDSL